MAKGLTIRAICDRAIADGLMDKEISSLWRKGNAIYVRVKIDKDTKVNLEVYSESCKRRIATQRAFDERQMSLFT